MSFQYDVARNHAAGLAANDRLKLAKALAANCGYQLVEAEQDARTKQIKQMIGELKRYDGFVAMSESSRGLLIEGLEGLLK